MSTDNDYHYCITDDEVKKLLLENGMCIFTPHPKQKRVEFEVDCKFWSIVPQFNINIHSRGIEFLWLCFGVYIKIGKL